MAVKTPIPSILLVKDDPNDIFFMQRAINKAKLQLSVQVAVNGEEAMNYLAGKDRFVDRTAYPLPCCVFVNLKIRFLRWHAAARMDKRPAIFIELTRLHHDGARRRGGGGESQKVGSARLCAETTLTGGINEITIEYP